MRHAARLLVAEEQQVTGLVLAPIGALLHNLARESLLRSVALQDDAVAQVAHLGQSRAVGHLGRSAAPQVAGTQHATCRLLDLGSVEALAAPLREFVDIGGIDPAYPTVGRGEFYPFSLCCLEFQDVTHHQVANGLITARHGHQTRVITGDDIALCFAPGLHLRLGLERQRTLGDIGDVVIRHLHAVPAVTLLQHLDRGTHDALRCHFGTVLGLSAQGSDTQFDQSPLA